jgi:Protein of unknown function (DUF4038)/Putative collagen-binding domain of a collagenase
MRRHFFISVFFVFIAESNVIAQMNEFSRLTVSSNGHYLMTKNGKPFFWLGDTGWLLFSKLTREEADEYLEDRRKKGFNVIQVMVLHSLDDVNVYGDSALTDENVAKPKVKPGKTFNNKTEYDFWDHVDYIIDEGAKKGLYMALVPVWGSLVRQGLVNRRQAKIYAAWLANRYKNKPNIIWINGGDILGSDSLDVWNTIGNTLHAIDENHLVTFHPRGRTISSIWFQNAKWLQLNMFQSGHRNYAQDTASNEPFRFGEDNWKYVNLVYNKKPVKPVLDGEPSYEGIPYGLHDTTLARWQDKDVRRYAYWSVFAGAAGFTYGDNAVIQMHKPGDKNAAYGANKYWFQAINDPGSSQIIWLKKLVLSKSYFDRIPDISLVADQGKRYNYIAATRGKDYAFFYDYMGRTFKVNMGKIRGSKVKATWYNPAKGTKKLIGLFVNKGVHNFRPPGEEEEGNDWVLILESK